MVTGWALVVPPSVTCLVDLLSLFSILSKAHLGYLHLVSLPEMVFFLLEQLRLAAHSGGPMGEGVDYTKFGWEVMVTVPLQVLVSMSGFPVHSDVQCTISLWFNNGVQKGMDPSSLLSSTVNFMAGSTLFMCWRICLFHINFMICPCYRTYLFHSDFAMCFYPSYLLIQKIFLPLCSLYSCVPVFCSLFSFI